MLSRSGADFSLSHYVDAGLAASFSNAGTGRWANCKCAFQHGDYSARQYGPDRLPLAVLIALVRLSRGTQARPPNTATIAAMHVLQRPSDARAAPVRCKRRLGGLAVTGCRAGAGAGPGAGAQVRWDYKVDEMEGGRGEAEDVDESLPPSQEPSQAAAAAADSWAAGGGGEGAGAAGSCPGLSRGSKRIRAGPE